MANRNTSSRPV